MAAFSFFLVKESLVADMTNTVTVTCGYGLLQTKVSSTLVLTASRKLFHGANAFSVEFLLSIICEWYESDIFFSG